MLVTVIVPDETHHTFKRACLDLGLTMSDVLRRAIDEAILVSADITTEKEMQELYEEQK